MFPIPEKTSVQDLESPFREKNEQEKEEEHAADPNSMAAMASPTDSELSPALLKVTTHVYRFPLPATKVIAFTKCFADNLGADETSKTIR